MLDGCGVSFWGDDANILELHRGASLKGDTLTSRGTEAQLYVLGSMKNKGSISLLFSLFFLHFKPSLLMFIFLNLFSLSSLYKYVHIYMSTHKCTLLELGLSDHRYFQITPDVRFNNKRTQRVASQLSHIALMEN